MLRLTEALRGLENSWVVMDVSGVGSASLGVAGPGVGVIAVEVSVGAGSWVEAGRDEGWEAVCSGEVVGDVVEV